MALDILEELVKLIDEIDNYKAMIMNKAAHQQVISIGEMHRFEQNVLLRPHLVAEKENLRLERNRRNIIPQ